MKIAVLSSHTPSLFWFRMDMMEAFMARGHEVIAVGNEAEANWKDKFLKKGIRYRQADIQRNGTNPLKDFYTLKSLKKILKEEYPDCIFVYQAKTIIYGGMAANQLGITEVYPLIAGVGSLFLSKTLKARLLRFVLKMEYTFSMRKCPYVFFQNQDDVHDFTEMHIVKKERIVMLNGSGVNLDKFQWLPMPEESAFLCISRLIRDKGIYEYLQASKRIKELYPSVRCLLVGPYDTNPSSLKSEELQPYIENGIIEYFGEQSDVRPYLAQCTVFVLPSYREGTPKTVLEAMACGRAVITTDAPGCRETVIDGVNGYLVPVKNVTSLTEKMQVFIENPELTYKMAESGRKLAEEKYDVRIVNDIICSTMNL